jgi:enoyl-CoA hydratase/carnithine racemase
MIDVSRDGEVTLLRMDEGENRFRPDFLRAWNDALDALEGAEGPRALVTTGTGKFYSNGLDLDWMLGEGRDEAEDYIPGVLRLLARVLTFPCITVAAVNGHAFGAGAQLVVAHDYRVMRTGRGYFCMPEIDMRARLHPGMTAILQARLPHPTVHEVIATGRRYPAEEALACQIVDEVAAEEEVVARAVEIAAPLAAKAHPVMTTLKRDMYPRALEALEARFVP